MIWNYLKSAIRNIRTQKGYAFINILGLSIGLAATILIMLWVVNELSFNRNNKNFSNIYRVVQQQMYSSGPLTTPCMPGPLAADLKNDFPEFVDVFRFYEISGVISYKEKRFADYVQLADSGLFNVFSFQFLQGSPKTALQPYTTILSRKGAEKYFGDEDPMGKVLKLNNELSLRVNGIIENPPENSSFDKEIFIPFQHLKDLGWTIDRYGWNTFYIYVQLPENVDYAQVNDKIKDYFKKIRDDDELQVELFLFPLKNERLYSFTGAPAQITNIYIFSIIAIFILLIACINFMNLATARASKRGREIGLRKVVGAQQRQLIFQFISESVVMALLALVISIILTTLFLPTFNDLTEKTLTFNLLNPYTIITLLGIALLTGLVAGSYPAFYMATLNPLKTIRKSTSGVSGNPWFRRSLVVFQFVLSIGLIISTIVIYKQITYIQDKNLGMNKENVIYARVRGDMPENFYDFKNKILQDPNVIDASRSSHIPFYVGSNSGGLGWLGKDTDDDVLIGFERADWDYLETMQMELVEGRFFEQGYSTDSTAVVVNESAIKTMGMKDPIGKWISFGDDEADRYTIIGVLKDFHFLPFNHEIEPLSVFFQPQESQFMLIKVNGQKTEEAIAHIEKTWNNFLPAFPFEYRFLDDYYGKIYSDEASLARLIKYFAILAIIISCLGLFGLASFTAAQRTKEIGIRKVLGSSIGKIIILQQREFIWLVVVANVISWPVSWYFMNNWLDSYVYKINLSFIFFFIAGGLSLAITFLTVFFLAYRAALKNPVDAIKYE